MQGLLTVIDSWDKAFFRWINRDLADPTWDAVMPYISDFLVYLPLLLLLLVWLYWRHRSWRRMLALAVGAAALIILTDWVTSSLIRPWLARPRPSAQLLDIRVFDNKLWHLTDPAWIKQAAGSFGLPSAHAANSMGLAVYFSRFHPRLGALMALIALVIGLSRIYLGAHFLGDVLLGYLWGGLCGLAVSAAVARTVDFSSRDDIIVRQFD